MRASFSPVVLAAAIASDEPGSHRAALRVQLFACCQRLSEEFECLVVVAGLKEDAGVVVLIRAPRVTHLRDTPNMITRLRRGAELPKAPVLSSP
jgi:hypothetical protein